MIIGQDAVDVINNALGPSLLFMGVLMPVVLRFLTRYIPENDAKKAVGVVGAIVVVAVSLVTDPVDVTLPLLTARFAAAFPLVEGSYRLLNGAGPVTKAFVKGSTPTPGRYEEPSGAEIRYND